MKNLVFALIALLVWTGCTSKSGEEKEVNLSIWANYIPPETEKKFFEKTGYKLRVSNYASNEELLAKLQAGGSGIDVAVPSDYMVEIMQKQGLLEGLDNAQVPNKALISQEYLAQKFDPTNRFSLPYAWSTSGLAVNRAAFKSEIKGWKDLLKYPELKGRISLLDDPREVLGVGLKVNGFSINDQDEKDLRSAQAWLKGMKPMVKMFRSDIADPLLNKEIFVAHAYSSDALKVAARPGADIEYIIPEEGGIRAIDNLVIIKGAKHPQAAHVLINYFLSPEANLEFVRHNKGGPVLAKTKEKLPSDMQKLKGLFPENTVMAKLESIQDIGEATTLIDRIWTEFKTGR